MGSTLRPQAKNQGELVENSVEEANIPDRQERSETVTPSEVRKTLSAILKSAPFRSSLQIQKLLQYIVTETLAGRAETLKERVIGTSIFEKRPDYDTNQDPIVRLRVAEVRKRLAVYYQMARDERVLISIPSGSFRAVFDPARKEHVPSLPTTQLVPEPIPLQDEPISEPAPREVAEPDVKAPPARFRFRVWWIPIAASVAILALVSLRYFVTREDRAFNQFWSPVLNNSDTILIGMGNNPTYELSHSYEDEYFKSHPGSRYEEAGLHPYVPIPPGATIDGKDIHLAENTYLTIGDLMALSDIEYMMARRSRKLDIRFVNDIAFGDLRQSPTILIGAHNNVWTLGVTENLRFGFKGHSAIVDRSDPQRSWAANPDRSETYAIVARVLNSWNGKVVVAVGGVGYAGTRAAADYITDPRSIAKLAKSLPKGWESKSIEVVLHTSVKNQIPSAPDVVATYCW
jgi:hypothetical protein